MDAEGARELARRIGSNTTVAVPPLSADVSVGALSVYRWFGGDCSGVVARATEPAPPTGLPSLRRLRVRVRGR